jgi:2-keto-4-pentenoate hydratase/2-oxohepta-3-ene-1,7-dioic acid hydratase in catechol pathway
VVEHSPEGLSKVKKASSAEPPALRLCTFSLKDEAPTTRLGIVDGTRVGEVAGMESMIEYLRSEERSPRLSGNRHEIADVVLHAPVPRPGKIVAAIVNTRGMLGGDDVLLDRPRLDMKAPSTVVGSGAVIRAPTSGVRPEVELAAVIGRRLSKSTPEEALEGIAGYTALNDVTSPRDSKDDAYEAYRRDPRSGDVKRTVMRGPLFRSKNHDGFCPMGPWLVTPDELGKTTALKMTTRFDGRVFQEGSTEDYIFSAQQIASYVSSFLTLEPGDVVSCGSVGWTKEAIGKLDPTEFVLPASGGTLEIEIERIGVLVNRLVPESGTGLRT